jgi:hypothetical protein
MLPCPDFSVEMGSCSNFLPELAWNHNPPNPASYVTLSYWLRWDLIYSLPGLALNCPVSVSQVARITGVSHQFLALLTLQTPIVRHTVLLSSARWPRARQRYYFSYCIRGVAGFSLSHYVCNQFSILIPLLLQYIQTFLFPRLDTDSYTYTPMPHVLICKMSLQNGVNNTEPAE